MIDAESFHQLPVEWQSAVRSAMCTIVDSQVISIQKIRDFERVLHGAADEDPTLLANRIIEHRKSQYALDAFLAATTEIKELPNA